MSAGQVVLGAGVGTFAAGELVQSLRMRRGSRVANLGAELLFRLVFFAGILTLAAGHSVMPAAETGPPAVVFWPAVTLGWCGLLLRWWSFVTLGRWFTVVLRTSPDQPVIDRGPYQFVRHPSYGGLLLAFAGCAAALGNAATGPVAVMLLVAALVFRIRIEERALVDALGARYVEFGRTRSRLVPHVW